LASARQARNSVAQIFNLLYRRIGFGTVSERCDALARSNGPQSTTLRYSRVQLCATAARAATEVAQIFNLPYRRIRFGRVSDRSETLGLCDATQITNLRYGRVQLCATFGDRRVEVERRLAC
jgi:hypothetical protein